MSMFWKFSLVGFAAMGAPPQPSLILKNTMCELKLVDERLASLGELDLEKQMKVYKEMGSVARDACIHKQEQTVEYVGKIDVGSASLLDHSRYKFEDVGIRCDTVGEFIFNFQAAEVAGISIENFYMLYGENSDSGAAAICGAIQKRIEFVLDLIAFVAYKQPEQLQPPEYPPNKSIQNTQVSAMSLQGGVRFPNTSSEKKAPGKMKSGLVLRASAGKSKWTLFGLSNDLVKDEGSKERLATGLFLSEFPTFHTRLREGPKIDGGWHRRWTALELQVENHGQDQVEYKLKCFNGPNASFTTMGIGEYSETMPRNTPDIPGVSEKPFSCYKPSIMGRSLIDGAEYCRKAVSICVKLKTFYDKLRSSSTLGPLVGTDTVRQSGVKKIEYSVLLEEERKQLPLPAFLELTPPEVISIKFAEIDQETSWLQLYAQSADASRVKCTLTLFGLGNGLKNLADNVVNRFHTNGQISPCLTDQAGAVPGLPAVAGGVNAWSDKQVFWIVIERQDDNEYSISCVGRHPGGTQGVVLSTFSLAFSLPLPVAPGAPAGDPSAADRRFPYMPQDNTHTQKWPEKIVIKRSDGAAFVGGVGAGAGDPPLAGTGHIEAINLCRRMMRVQYIVEQTVADQAYNALNMGNAANPAIEKFRIGKSEEEPTKKNWRARENVPAGTMLSSRRREGLSDCKLELYGLEIAGNFATSVPTRNEEIRKTVGKFAPPCLSDPLSSSVGRFTEGSYPLVRVNPQTDPPVVPPGRPEEKKFMVEVFNDAGKVVMKYYGKTFDAANTIFDLSLAKKRNERVRIEVINFMTNGLEVDDSKVFDLVKKLHSRYNSLQDALRKPFNPANDPAGPVRETVTEKLWNAGAGAVPPALAAPNTLIHQQVSINSIFDPPQTGSPPISETSVEIGRTVLEIKDSRCTLQFGGLAKIGVDRLKQLGHILSDAKIFPCLPLAPGAAVLFPNEPPARRPKLLYLQEYATLTENPATGESTLFCKFNFVTSKRARYWYGRQGDYIEKTVSALYTFETQDVGVHGVIRAAGLQHGNINLKTGAGETETFAQKACARMKDSFVLVSEALKSQGAPVPSSEPPKFAVKISEPPKFTVKISEGGDTYENSASITVPLRQSGYRVSVHENEEFQVDLKRGDVRLITFHGFNGFDAPRDWNQFIQYFNQYIGKDGLVLPAPVAPNPNPRLPPPDHRPLQDHEKNDFPLLLISNSKASLVDSIGRVVLDWHARPEANRLDGLGTTWTVSTGLTRTVYLGINVIADAAWVARLHDEMIFTVLFIRDFAIGLLSPVSVRYALAVATPPYTLPFFSDIKISNKKFHYSLRDKDNEEENWKSGTVVELKSGNACKTKLHLEKLLEHTTSRVEELVFGAPGTKFGGCIDLVSMERASQDPSSDLRAIVFFNSNHAAPNNEVTVFCEKKSTKDKFGIDETEWEHFGMYQTKCSESTDQSTKIAKYNFWASDLTSLTQYIGKDVNNDRFAVVDDKDSKFFKACEAVLSRQILFERAAEIAFGDKDESMWETKFKQPIGALSRGDDSQLKYRINGEPLGVPATREVTFAGKEPDDKMSVSVKYANGCGAVFYAEALVGANKAIEKLVDKFDFCNPRHKLPAQFIAPASEHLSYKVHGLEKNAKIELVQAKSELIEWKATLMSEDNVVASSKAVGYAKNTVGTFMGQLVSEDWKAKYAVQMQYLNSEVAKVYKQTDTADKMDEASKNDAFTSKPEVEIKVGTTTIKSKTNYETLNPPTGPAVSIRTQSECSISFFEAAKMGPQDIKLAPSLLANGVSACLENVIAKEVSASENTKYDFLLQFVSRKSVGELEARVEFDPDPVKQTADIRFLVIEKTGRKPVISLRMTQQKAEKIPGLFFLDEPGTGLEAPSTDFKVVNALSGRWKIALARAEKIFASLLAVRSIIHDPSDSSAKPTSSSRNTEAKFTDIVFTPKAGEFSFLYPPSKRGTTGGINAPTVASEGYTLKLKDGLLCESTFFNLPPDPVFAKLHSWEGIPGSLARLLGMSACVSALPRQPGADDAVSVYSGLSSISIIHNENDQQVQVACFVGANRLAEAAVDWIRKIPGRSEKVLLSPGFESPLRREALYLCQHLLKMREKFVAAVENGDVMTQLANAQRVGGLVDLGFTRGIFDGTASEFIAPSGANEKALAPRKDHVNVKDDTEGASWQSHTFSHGTGDGKKRIVTSFAEDEDASVVRLEFLDKNQKLVCSIRLGSRVPGTWYMFTDAAKSGTLWKTFYDLYGFSDACKLREGTFSNSLPHVIDGRRFAIRSGKDIEPPGNEQVNILEETLAIPISVLVSEDKNLVSEKVRSAQEALNVLFGLWFAVTQAEKRLETSAAPAAGVWTIYSGGKLQYLKDKCMQDYASLELKQTLTQDNPEKAVRQIDQHIKASGNNFLPCSDSSVAGRDKDANLVKGGLQTSGFCVGISYSWDAKKNKKSFVLSCQYGGLAAVRRQAMGWRDISCPAENQDKLRRMCVVMLDNFKLLINNRRQQQSMLDDPHFSAPTGKTKPISVPQWKQRQAEEATPEKKAQKEVQRRQKKFEREVQDTLSGTGFSADPAILEAAAYKPADEKGVELWRPVKAPPILTSADKTCSETFDGQGFSGFAMSYGKDGIQEYLAALKLSGVQPCMRPSDLGDILKALKNSGKVEILHATISCLEDDDHYLVSCEFRERGNDLSVTSKRRGPINSLPSGIDVCNLPVGHETLKDECLASFFTSDAVNRQLAATRRDPPTSSSSRWIPVLRADKSIWLSKRENSDDEIYGLMATESSKGREEEARCAIRIETGDQSQTQALDVDTFVEKTRPHLCAISKSLKTIKKPKNLLNLASPTFRNVSSGNKIDISCSYTLDTTELKLSRSLYGVSHANAKHPFCQAIGGCKEPGTVPKNLDKVCDGLVQVYLMLLDSI